MYSDIQSKIKLKQVFKVKQFLQQQLKKYIFTNDDEQLNLLISQIRQQRELRNYLVYTQNSNDYLRCVWKKYFQNLYESQSTKKQQQTTQISRQGTQRQDNQENYHSPKEFHLNTYIYQITMERQNHIVWQIQTGQLQIQKQNKKIKIQQQNHIKKLLNDKQQLNKQLHSLKQGLNQLSAHKDLKQSNSQKQSRVSMDSSKSKKQYYEFMKKQKLQRQKRAKLLLQQQKRHEKQLLKQQQDQQKQKQQKLQKKMQQKRQKQKQMLQKRNNLKQTKDKHEQNYLQVKNKLFHKSTQKFLAPQSSRYKEQPQQLRIKLQRKKVLQSCQKQKIDEHQKRYIQYQNKIKQAREIRLKQVHELQRLQTKQQAKLHSSFSFQFSSDKYQKQKQQQYQTAKQKRQKMLIYQEKLKQSFIPKVDENKRNQLIKIIQHFGENTQGNYVKRRKDIDGKIRVEKLQIRDNKQLGKVYLQNVKQMVREIRTNRTNQGQTAQADRKSKQLPKASKPINYLHQLRQKSQNRQKSTSYFSSPRTTFSQTKSSNQSFQEKVQKMQSLSNKLLQKTRQQQMLLKFGKFKTSEEILQKKQIIDRNYIDLLNMKLRIIQGEDGDFQ